MHYEHINGAKINIERLTDDELENLKGHVQAKLDEVLEDFSLVMEEISKRSPQEEWQDPLDNFPLNDLQQPVEQTVPSE